LLKGHEKEMFAKLAHKFRVPNPLGKVDQSNMRDFSPSKAPSVTEPSASTVPESSSPDYHKILTEFYKKYNPSKLADVGRYLEKYKVRRRNDGSNCIQMSAMATSPNTFIHDLKGA
jgi:hypothetical protein